MSLRFLLHFSPHGRRAPKMVRDFAERVGHELVEVSSVDELVTRVNRAYPMAVVVDASRPADPVLSLCRAVKAEPFTAVVPVIAYVVEGGAEANADALEAGADEVLCGDLVDRECRLRLHMALWRAERDVSVHPTTRLPGTVQIERDIGVRLASGERFAVCYADLDHFKEFNDRYGYNNGDRVILLLSRILRDVVRARSPNSFVGHIGGDDFIFNAPLDDFRICCEEVISVFEELIPFQYSMEDRERGFFHGKDRRGEVYEVPLMTLSIGVVTNEHRNLTHTAQISELATEMKAYAKTLPGSVYAVDRRKS
jgi:GGDEF domain-containing protein